jgi:hypothetical protein
MGGFLNPYRFASAGGGGTRPTAPALPTSTKWRLYVNQTQSSGAWLSIAEIEMHASLNSADQCNGGTATASAQSGSAPVGNCFNNSTASRYQSGTSTKPIWVQYEFPSAVAVAEYLIFASSASDLPKDFKIQYLAADGVTWVDVYSNTSETSWAGWKYFNLQDPIAFYSDVRLVCTATQGTSGNWPRIAELQMRAASGGANQCTGGTPYSSGWETGYHGSAFDGSASSFWLAGKPASLAPWIAYRWDGAVGPDIVEIAIQAWSSGANDTPTAGTVQRHNGTAWVDLWSWTTPATWVAGEQRVFTKP